MPIIKKIQSQDHVTLIVGISGSGEVIFILKLGPASFDVVIPLAYVIGFSKCIPEILLLGFSSPLRADVWHVRKGLFCEAGKRRCHFRLVWIYPSLRFSSLFFILLQLSKSVCNTKYSAQINSCRKWWYFVGLSVIMTSWAHSHFYLMMTSSNENNFRVTGPLCEEFTGHRWIPRSKTSDAVLWCVLRSAPEQTLE